ncbi:MAG: ATP-binding cassette domain-containing protein [Clostridiales bacterium]|nr:ATP-binding cassette domain-containing protein [Clostridiales bacterium]
MNAQTDSESHKLGRVAPEFSKRVDRILRVDEKVEFALPADLNLKGYFDSCALFLTDERIISFDPEHKNGIFIIEIEDIKEAQVEEMYGNAIFNVVYKNKVIELNRYTQTVSNLFRELSDYINRDENKDNGEELLKEDRETISGNRCPKCGRVLRRRSNICPYCIDKKKVLVRLMGYVKPYMFITIAGLISSILIAAISLAPPYLTKILVDEVVNTKSLLSLRNIVIGLLGIYIFQAVFGGLRLYLLRYLSNHLVFDIRQEAFAKAQYLTVSYYDKRSTGSIMSRINSDTNQLQNFIIQATQEMLVQVLTLLGIGIIMFSMHWQLAILTLAPVPIIIFISRRFSHKIHPIYHRVWRRRSRMNAVLSDSIPGIRVTKAFTGENREIGEYASRGEELLQEQLRAARMNSMFNPIVSFLVALGGLLVWGLGGYWMITKPDILTLGTLVAFINYMGRFYGPVEFFARMNDSIQQAATSAERVFEIIDAVPEPNIDEGMTLDTVKGSIEFKDVDFYYDKGENVLEDINLKIEPGETVGLVGSTGSGKSTIVNLIMRYYEPTDGKILLDGIDLRDIDMQSLRKHTGIVLQDPFLFRDTIANNIAYGNPGVSIEQIIEAAKTANAHDFISKLPDAYDTHLGERGIGLSGGERQRISIARAVIRDPHVLILDEATSAVDTHTEKLIQEAIDRLIQNRTTIIIAHRLSTLRKADKIVVLDDGKIVEMGTHNELMERRGKFYKMIEMQADMGTDMLKVV